jgi:hypothetical protein
VKNLFSNSDIEELTKLRGSIFSFVAGPTLWEFLSADLVFLVCGNQRLSIQGDIFDSSFEGFEGQYSRLIISTPNDVDLEKSVLEGSAYYFHSGETVLEVAVIRDTIEFFSDGIKSWEYVTDSGFVLNLSGGAVAITKLGHHDELLQVTYWDEFSMLTVPETDGHFESDLYQNYNINREIIPLG